MSTISHIRIGDETYDIGVAEPAVEYAASGTLNISGSQAYGAQIRISTASAFPRSNGEINMSGYMVMACNQSAWTTSERYGTYITVYDGANNYFGPTPFYDRATGGTFTGCDAGDIILAYYSEGDDAWYGSIVNSVGSSSGSGNRELKVKSFRIADEVKIPGYECTDVSFDVTMDDDEYPVCVLCAYFSKDDLWNTTVTVRGGGTVDGHRITGTCLAANLYVNDKTADKLDIDILYYTE